MTKSHEEYEVGKKTACMVADELITELSWAISVLESASNIVAVRQGDHAIGKSPGKNHAREILISIITLLSNDILRHAYELGLPKRPR